MSTTSTRPPKQSPESPRFLYGDDTGAYIQDAARTPDGHTTAVAQPSHEGHISWLMEQPHSYLVIGAQSSLTGGATPFGEQVILTDRFQAFEAIDERFFRVGAGVPLMTLQSNLRDLKRFFPPVPTYDGAFIGGSVATNAAGAKTLSLIHI